MTDLKYRRMSFEQHEIFKQVADLQAKAWEKLAEQAEGEYNSHDVETIPEWIEARELAKKIFGDFDKDGDAI